MDEVMLASSEIAEIKAAHRPAQAGWEADRHSVVLLGKGLDWWR